MRDVSGEPRLGSGLLQPCQEGAVADFSSEEEDV